MSRKKKKQKNLMEDVKEYIPVVTAIVSAISLILTGLFKAGTYLYSRGCFDVWNVPVDYISINYPNVLYKFLVTTIFVAVFIGLSGVYVFFFLRIIETKKILVRILKILAFILLVPTVVTVFFLIYLAINVPIKDIWAYIAYYPIDFFRNIVIVSLICFPCIFSAGQFVCFYVPYCRKNKESIANEREKEKTSKEEKEDDSISANTEENNEVVHKHLNKSIIYIMIGILFLIAGILVMAYTIYDTGKKSVANAKKVEMLYIEEKSYVIIGQYEDNWILKECIFSSDMHVINKDHYMISDVVGKDIFIITLENEENIQTCLVSQETFEGIQETLYPIQ